MVKTEGYGTLRGNKTKDAVLSNTTRGSPHLYDKTEIKSKLNVRQVLLNALWKHRIVSRTEYPAYSFPLPQAHCQSC
jgi:hypothetical protein